MRGRATAPHLGAPLASRILKDAASAEGAVPRGVWPGVLTRTADGTDVLTRPPGAASKAKIRFAAWEMTVQYRLEKARFGDGLAVPATGPVTVNSRFAALGTIMLYWPD
jgi:hypothetical protein